MYETLKKHRGKVIVALLILSVLAVAAFSFRDVYRTKLLPAYTQRHRTQALQAAYTQGYAELGEPFQALGMSYSAGSPHCNLDWAHNYSSNVYCLVQAEVGTSPIQTDNSQKLQAAASLDQKINQNGWYNLKSGPDDVASAVEVIKAPLYYYEPWNTYYGNNLKLSKKIGDIICSFSLSSNYTNVISALFLHGEYSCSQQFQYFGDPYK